VLGILGLQGLQFAPQFFVGSEQATEVDKHADDLDTGLDCHRAI
jgi:hypothetical protein